MLQFLSTIKIYDKRDNSENILMTDISRTDIIFHQIRDPTILGGTDTLPQSHIHTNATFQIPYICRMDYKIHDKTKNARHSMFYYYVSASSNSGPLNEIMLGV